ncbi:hypothetical protein ACFVJS_03790 [Nocardioides sp. NPDC057772]|uniref:hypothetical protein n=1 Tax=Nocardioides sp. NPDC057772 TaxID=3346245 RepID=UPI00367114B7
MASLADMRARKAKTGRAIAPLSDVVEICTDPEAFADMARLTDELNELDDRMRLDAQRRSDGPRRVAEGDDPDPENVERREKLRADLAEARERVKASLGKLKIEAIPGGDWARWKDNHPPRDNAPADAIYGLNLVDTTALLEDLDKWVVSWEDEPLAAGDWEMFAPLSAELASTVRAVVLLQEQGLSDAPKLLSAASSTSTFGGD